MQANDDIATQVQAEWGAVSMPVLLGHRENAVYHIALPGGDSAALRLHRPGYHTLDEIEAELWWCNALADAGMTVPRPVPTSAGHLTKAAPDGRAATVISWVAGTPIGEGDVPLAGTGDEQVVLYRDIGRLLADLHGQSDALSLPPAFTRSDWNVGGFLGDKPLWGPFWEHPALTAAQADMLTDLRAHARNLLTGYTHQADYGLIHADPLRENILRTENGLGLIDFDDGGFGFRLYDLTTALVQADEDPERHACLLDAVVEGYSETRPIDDAGLRLLPLFTLLRHLAALGWIIPRYPADHPKAAQYIARCERWADRVLAL